MRQYRTADVADDETQKCSFEDLCLSSPLLRSLKEMGCEHPSPVQMRTIPAALAGDDLIVQAKSGTGKTIAFCSSTLEILIASGRQSQALILTPTREIALQVTDEITRLAWYMVPQVAIQCLIGGVPIDEDEERLQEQTPEVVVGTPGRVFKLLRDKKLKLALRLLVLDEADKLLDSNFRNDITCITERAWSDDLQFMTVSATFLPPLVAAAEALFVHVEKKKLRKGGTVTRDLPTSIFLCSSAVKKDLGGRTIAGQGEEGADVQSAVLRGVLHFRYIVEGYHTRQKMPALLEVLSAASYRQAFVFCPDSDSAVQVAELLNQSGISAASSSGRMDQAWRTQAFAGLKLCHYRVLVCTDLLARGVDVEQVDLVVNLGVPAEKETYLHRSGRTARFGSVGWSVNIVFQGEEAQHLMYFQMQLGFELADWEEREEATARKMQELQLPSTDEATAEYEDEAAGALVDDATSHGNTKGKDGNPVVQGRKRVCRKEFDKALEGQQPDVSVMVAASMATSMMPEPGATATSALAECVPSVSSSSKPKLKEASRSSKLERIWSFKQVVVGGTVFILNDETELLAACRKAGIAANHDHLRKQALGLTACVLGKDSSDDTVKVNVPSLGNIWFPFDGLCRRSGDHSAEVSSEEEDQGQEEDSDQQAEETVIGLGGGSHGGAAVVAASTIASTAAAAAAAATAAAAWVPKQPRRPADPPAGVSASQPVAEVQSNSTQKEHLPASKGRSSRNSKERGGGLQQNLQIAEGPCGLQASLLTRGGFEMSNSRAAPAAGPRTTPTQAGSAQSGKAARHAAAAAAAAADATAAAPPPFAEPAPAVGSYRALISSSSVPAPASAIAPAATPAVAAAAHPPEEQLLSRLLPPPVLIEEYMSSAGVPLPPQWEAWMLSCGSYGEYSSSSVTKPGQESRKLKLSPAVQERLDALWTQHRAVWTAVE